MYYVVWIDGLPNKIFRLENEKIAEMLARLNIREDCKIRNYVRGRFYKGKNGEYYNL